MVKNHIYKNLPDTPGVYIMRGAGNKILYVGKAGNLKRRVSSYFLLARHSLGVGGRGPSFAKASEGKHDSRIEKLVSEIKKIEYKKTDTAIEALILEAELIKKYQPPYNVREKDDSSFLFVEIVKEKFPRVLLVRGKNFPPVGGGKRYGPFTSSSSIREALKIIRRIFPFSTHQTEKPLKRPCFDYQIGLCPGTCLPASYVIGSINRTNYIKNIRNLELFFEGKKKKIIQSLEKEMAQASKKTEYEKAERIKRQLFALQHIQDVALIKEPETKNIESKTKNYRIEGYDISNISGTSAVGSMVVFNNNEPDKNEYRKFKIKSIFKPDDTGMIKEILTRRFRNPWLRPDLILIDGGKGQVNAAREILAKLGIKIPVVGLAKGPERKRNDIIGRIPGFTDLKTLIRVRDEAHRFAIAYHKKIRGEEFMR